MEFLYIRKDFIGPRPFLPQRHRETGTVPAAQNAAKQIDRIRICVRLDIKAKHHIGNIARSRDDVVVARCTGCKTAGDLCGGTQGLGGWMLNGLQAVQKRAPKGEWKTASRDNPDRILGPASASANGKPAHR